MYGSGPSPRVPDSVMFTVVVDYSTNIFPVPSLVTLTGSPSEYLKLTPKVDCPLGVELIFALDLSNATLRLVILLQNFASVV